MIRTLWAWCAGIVLTVSMGALVILLSFLGPTRGILHLCARIWARGILTAAGVKVKVQGLENLRTDSPQILASNHQGYFDIFTLFAHIPIRFGWLTKKELFQIPIFGYAMKRFGNIRIDRSNREKALKSLKVAAQEIKEGNSIMMFPEGTRSPDGKIQPFKKGCYYLAEASGVAVVPISISGSFEIMPKKHFLVTPGTIHLVIGRPLHVQGQYEKNRNGFTAQLRETIIRNQVPV